MCSRCAISSAISLLCFSHVQFFPNLHIYALRMRERRVSSACLQAAKPRPRGACKHLSSRPPSVRPLTHRTFSLTLLSLGVQGPSGPAFPDIRQAPCRLRLVSTGGTVLAAFNNT